MKIFKNKTAELIAYPMGGLGAGMLCLEGNGAISHVSIHHQPDLNFEPQAFSAITIFGDKPVAKVLEGPVPGWKISGKRVGALAKTSGNGLPDTTYGLPRFKEATFQASFPFATVKLNHPDIPLDVQIRGWSPFVPGDEDHSGLPAAALEFQFTNPTDKPIEALYTFNAMNFMKTDPESGLVEDRSNGFLLHDKGTEKEPWKKGWFSVETDSPGAQVNAAWFRGAWFDPVTMIWKDIVTGNVKTASPPSQGDPSPGATLYIPFKLQPGQSITIPVRFSWYVPKSNLSVGDCSESCCCKTGAKHEPWYAEKFSDIDQIRDYWATQYHDLLNETESFSECLYHTTLPDEIMEAIGANLCILKSPTLLRQKDGRLWGFEGCCHAEGCCHGTCTHVYNYVPAIAHFFPNLERGMREVEFHENQQKNGKQAFRANLPISNVKWEFYSAADGQLGGILKAYRDWRISGKTDWLKQLWPDIKTSMEYCINTWDPERKGIFAEPHHNTYDIEFWGPNGFSTTFYLAALKAFSIMAQHLGEDNSEHEELYTKTRQYFETELFDGEYYNQKVQWRELNASSSDEWKKGYSPEALAILEKEGPKYQYGKGCLSDGVLGLWVAETCGLSDLAHRDKTASHLQSVYRYNLRETLADHVNPQRPGFALGEDGGLLLGSWPKGEEPALPFPYSNEVWTGIEYQVAAHLIMHGYLEEGCHIVRLARKRYDGTTRNPFSEYECGHWYVRALASYSLLQAWSGAWYDKVTEQLTITPPHTKDFRAFFCWDGGYGTVGQQNGEPFMEVKKGSFQE